MGELLRVYVPVAKLSTRTRRAKPPGIDDIAFHAELRRLFRHGDLRIFLHGNARLP